MKNLTGTKRTAKEWLESQGYEDVFFNRKGSPDFLLPDGRKIEVKRLVKNTIYFTKKQIEELDDKVEILIIDEKERKPIATVPFSIVSKALPYGSFEWNGIKYRVFQMVDREKIIIKCSTETKRSFLSYMYSRGYSNMEDALRNLLREAGFLREARAF